MNEFHSEPSVKGTALAFVGTKMFFYVCDLWTFAVKFSDAKKRNQSEQSYSPRAGRADLAPLALANCWPPPALALRVSLRPTA